MPLYVNVVIEFGYLGANSDGEHQGRVESTQNYIMHVLCNLQITHATGLTQPI